MVECVDSFLRTPWSAFPPVLIASAVSIRLCVSCGPGKQVQVVIQSQCCLHLVSGSRKPG